MLKHKSKKNFSHLNYAFSNNYGTAIQESAGTSIDDIGFFIM